MIKRLICAACLAIGVMAPSARADDNTLKTGPWYVFLTTPGGRLPFLMEVGGTDGAWTAQIINGPERVEVPIVRVEDGTVTFEFDHYDSRIVAKIYDNGQSFNGAWTKTRGPDDVPSIQIWGYAGIRPRFRQPRPSDVERAQQILAGTWRVRFEGSEQDAVARFKVDEQGLVTGTFLTPTGDYGYLSGSFVGSQLELSTFNGAHAFLFRARLEAQTVQDDQGTPSLKQSLNGGFWSGDWWNEAWSAVPDIDAKLNDPMKRVQTDKMIDFSSLHFPDLDGQMRTLDEEEFKGRCRIIEIFGSWCPNCHDASEMLKELYEQFADDGLSIVALAFEATGDQKRDSAQVKTYIKRVGIPYPVLLAGQADKAEASKKLPFIDELRAYPTFIITNDLGGVVMTYSGFSGPATGQDYDDLRELFTKTVKQVLKIR